MQKQIVSAEPTNRLPPPPSLILEALQVSLFSVGFCILSKLPLVVPDLEKSSVYFIFANGISTTLRLDAFFSYFLPWFFTLLAFSVLSSEKSFFWCLCIIRYPFQNIKCFLYVLSNVVMSWGVISCEKDTWMEFLNVFFFFQRSLFFTCTFFFTVC